MIKFYLPEVFMADNSSFPLARKLVLTYGWNSTSYQLINPGIQRWFAEEKDSVVGFVTANRVRVVVGAPVCAKEYLSEIAAEFEKEAKQKGEKVCYVCAEARLESVFSDSKSHAKVLLGAQPVWNPHHWDNIVKTNKSLRAQINRAKNKNVKVVEWTSEQAQHHPELKRCLHEWLELKGLPPLHFMVEPETLSRLYDRRIFVAKQAEKIVGFIVLSPVATRNGWLFEQFIHCPKSPNGTVELMIDTAMRKIAKDGYEYATLGLSPLSKRAKIKPFDNPLWLKILLAWSRKHGQRFYNFDGLDAFKSKLQPDNWEAVFAISNEPRFSFRTLYAIASAFSQNKPIRLFLGGLWKAVQMETKWIILRK